ncbi:MAG: hypothetical protein U9N12_08720, partial [Euryarchaeota archaeon]|nr:hypothetical protein [Euryarchaeota archaeon]
KILPQCGVHGVAQLIIEEMYILRTAGIHRNRDISTSPLADQPDKTPHIDMFLSYNNHVIVKYKLIIETGVTKNG